MPSAAAKKPPVDKFRLALYGKIQIAKEQLGLDDDAYRDILKVRYGKTSRTELRTPQLVDLVEHFKSLGFKPAPRRRTGNKQIQTRPLAQGREAKKIRALWLAGWNLGVVRDPSEAALNAFAKRLTGVDDMRWMDGEGAAKTIEALKDMLAREGFVSWEPYRRFDGSTFYHPRSRVLRAQWHIAYKLGLVRISDTAALDGWLDRFLKTPHKSNIFEHSPADLDRASALLGERIRKAKAEHAPPIEGRS